MVNLRQRGAAKKRTRRKKVGARVLFEHAGDGDAGPLADDGGDVFLVDFFFQHAGDAGVAALRSVQLLELFFELGHFVVLDFGDAIELALAGLLFGFEAEGFNFLFQFADAADGFALFGPARAKGSDLFGKRGGVALDDLAALDAVGVGFALEGFAFDFERGFLALELIDLSGHGADLDGERGGGFVDEVDGLVGEEAVADVAMRERGGGNDGRRP